MSSNTPNKFRDPDELLTVAQVAQEYKVNEETVRRWIKDRLIPYVPIGPFKMKRVRRGDVATPVEAKNGNRS